MKRKRTRNDKQHQRMYDAARLDAQEPMAELRKQLFWTGNGDNIGRIVSTAARLGLLGEMQPAAVPVKSGNN